MEGGANVSDKEARDYAAREGVSYATAVAALREKAIKERRQQADVKAIKARANATLQKRRLGALAASAPIRTPAIVEAAKKAARRAVGLESAPVVEPLPAPVIPAGDFWSNVLKDTDLSDDEKKQAIEAISKLAFFDSIHDFWPERGKKKKPAEGEEGGEPPVKTTTGEDDAEPIELDPKARIETVHARLVDSIRKYVGLEGADIRKLISANTAQTVASPADIEDNVLAYFSRTYSPFNQKEVNIKVKDILEKWKLRENFGNRWEAYQAAIRKLPDYINILIDGMFIKSLDPTQVGHIGFFILAFMNPDVNPGQSNPTLTFDMLPGDVGRIFERFTQVRNGIYPQNISDSAITSFTALQGRSTFYRANYSRADDATQPKLIQQVARSNAYTNDKYNIIFVDKGFGPKNRFGFHIDIRDKQTGEIVATIPFGNGKEQGPSVNYIMDVLYTNNFETAKSILNSKKTGSKVATFAGLNEVDPDLLFDIKRLGDQEQMLATTSYGITGDRFAGAFRRLLRKPGIFHSTKGMRIWRKPIVVDEAAQAKEAREFRRNKIILKLQLISGIKPVQDELLKMKAEVDKGAKTGTVFYRENGFRYGGLLTPEFLYENYTQVAERFATYILRTRMMDISRHIDKLLAGVIKLNNPDYDTAACLVGETKLSNPEEACPPQDAQITEEAIDGALDKLEEFIEGVEELKHMNITFRATKTDAGEIEESVEPIYTQLFQEDGRLIKGASSSIFNFSAGSFHNQDSGIATTVAKLLQVASSTKDIETSLPEINKFLVQYFQSRDEIKEAFFNDDIKNEVETVTDISSGEDMLTAARIMSAADIGKQGLIEVLNRVATGFEAAEAGPPAAVGGAGADVAQGEAAAGSPLQYRDLHDLFAKLCIQASLTIERLDQKYQTDLEDAYENAVGVAKQAAGPTNNINAAESAATAYMEEAENAAGVSYTTESISALNEIETKWITEVEQIRVHALDDYGAPFEETDTTDLISFLLSFRTLADGTGQPDALFRLNDREDAFRRREQVSLNDIGGLVLTNLPVERFILNVLSTIGTEVLTVANSNQDTNVEADKISNTYAAPANWKERLPNVIYVSAYKSAGKQDQINPEVRGLLGGGSLEEAEESTTNALPVTGSSRRRLYGGLRKGSGSGSPPEL